MISRPFSGEEQIGGQMRFTGADSGAGRGCTRSGAARQGVVDIGQVLDGDV